MGNVCLLPTKDTQIDGSAATTNYGTGATAEVDVGYIAGSKVLWRRTLITFQIPTEVASAEVYLAFLKLWCTSSLTTGTAAVLKRLTQAWTEAGVTWNKYDGVTNWATAGGDFTDVGAVSWATAAALTYKEIDVTALVQDAITSRSGLLDLILALSDENPRSNAGCTFATKEVIVDPTLHWQRPQLVIVRPPFGMPIYM